MSLLKSEIVANGFGETFFPKDILDIETQLKTSQLVNALKEITQIKFEKAEIVAVLLYTHKKLDIYVDLKTTMTCKEGKK